MLYRFSMGLVLTAVLAVAGCGVDREKGILMAAGSYGDLAVVVSDDNLRNVADRSTELFNPVRTFVIKPEPTFKTDLFGPDRWDMAKGYKNALFLVRLGDGGSVEKAARNQISAETWQRLHEGGGGVVQVNDPWSTYQYLVVVASRDRNNLASLVQKNGAKILELIEDSNRERILRRNRYDGLNTSQMDAYWRSFGFFMEIPGEYRENQVQPDGYPGLELMRNGPSRGISVSWFGSDDPVALLGRREFLINQRLEMGEKLHDEEILRETFVWSEVEIGGISALKLEGAWNSRRFTGGGAFWCYFIPDTKGKRLFTLDLLVFAPNLDKMGYFRRMDAVASTFSLDAPQR